jgi:arginyl-tRNA--protein-N-Asp/Glu arginylyltransferase
MKLVNSEFISDYNTYSFGYCIYAIYEPNIENDLSNIYNSGFLPYSGSRDLHNHFYLCRSLRINLQNFTLNSENRRMYKKFEGKYKREVLSNFESLDKEMQNFLIKFYTDYFKDFHGIGAMSNDRIKFILHFGIINKIILYKNEEGDIVGSVLLVNENDVSHYWYSAYSSELKNMGFGMWMIIEEVIQAQKENKKYFYLGTGYGQKAKYKLNFNNVEFWDGNQWQGDMSKLKLLIVNDENKKFENIIKKPEAKTINDDLKNGSEFFS